MIKNVLFDLDGTLLDTSEGIVKSVEYAIKELSFPVLSYAQMLTFVGPPVQESFKRHFGCDNEMAQHAANVFRDYYKEEALFLLARMRESMIFVKCCRIVASDWEWLHTRERIMQSDY